eukprot:TRINITY_DN35887_c0_g1_i1.p1 TRINITY_DN35887_c0_g1~~TRINITY_DN35887_c0_g1_i1.p1  ORF type:complete len:119 (+),score=15.54 TRINITY_DN35887_c0_g1_i1:92-448(+)
MLHLIERLFNSFDYAVLGVMGFLLALVIFTPVFKSVNSTMGRLIVLGITAYFYVRWQIDVMRIPMKSPDASDADKMQFFRMTRNVYMEFSGLILTLFSFVVARLRGRIQELEAGGKKA